MLSVCLTAWRCTVLFFFAGRCSRGPGVLDSNARAAKLFFHNTILAFGRPFQCSATCFTWPALVITVPCALPSSRRLHSETDVGQPSINPTFSSPVPPLESSDQASASPILSTPAAASASNMATSSGADVSVSTITIQSTLHMTTYTTIYITTTDGSSSSSSSSSCISTSIPEQLSTTSSSTMQPVNPVIASQHTHSTYSTFPSITLQLQSPIPRVSPTSVPVTTGPSKDVRRTAIIGGLSGSIAGLVLIGLILCICLRRRRLRNDGDSNPSATESGSRPAFVRKLSEWAGDKGTPKPTPRATVGELPVIIDDHLIRMSLDHWERPFARDDPFRDSVAPSQLRVMNPDPSRPATPQMTADGSGRFLQRQRSALAAVLLNANRSKSAQNLAVPQPQQSHPYILTDPALSKELAIPAATTPSFRSYPSVRSSAFVHQQPPEDPFLTPPLDEEKPKRPTLAPLQSVAGRTLSNISSVLAGWRSKTAAPEPVRAASSWSSSTLSSRRSARRDTERSDPFDLDRPSVRWSNDDLEAAGGEVMREKTPNWALYEGT